MEEFEILEHYDGDDISVKLGEMEKVMKENRERIIKLENEMKELKEQLIRSLGKIDELENVIGCTPQTMHRIWNKELRTYSRNKLEDPIPFFQIRSGTHPCKNE